MSNNLDNPPEKCQVSLSRQDLEDFAKNDIGFYGLDISRISSIFIAQVLQMQTNRTINTHQMLDEVKYLEGLRNVSSTKKAEQFKRQPLKGLMKKHFMDAGFIVQNIGVHFGHEYGGNKKLDHLIGEAFARNKTGYVDDEFINYLAHQSTVGMLENRAAKKAMTGEWIVFQSYKGENYYLTLAAHNEGDENILKRVNDAYDLNFPFLRGKLKA